MGGAPPEQNELQDRQMREAMAEAEQGLGIEHADVVASADSLGSPDPLALPTPKPLRAS
jgi:hypothetical protein